MTEEERRIRERMRKRKAARLKQLKRRRAILLTAMFAIVLLLVLAAVGIARLWLPPRVDLSRIQMPEWINQQFLTVNPYSRPGTKLESVNGVVVHYTANPGTTAQQNRDYFEQLSEQTSSNDGTNVSVSSHFIIDIDGSVIQCIPLDEIAYASNNRNKDTISIECCHKDKTGQFTQETYDSLVKLTSWLCRELKIKPEHIIRHYDVTKKMCPLYYVEHPDAWKKFIEDAKKAVDAKE